MAKLYFLTDKSIEALRKMRRKLGNVTGSGTVQVTNAHDGIAIAGLQRGQRQSQQSSPWFLAKLTSITAISAAAGRWVYDFTEVRLVGTFTGDTLTNVTTQDVTDGRTGKALNLAEIANTSSIAFAIDMTGTNYSTDTDFAPRPISGGSSSAQTHQQDVIVRMYWQHDADAGKHVYYFDRMGTHDGECV